MRAGGRLLRRITVAMSDTWTYPRCKAIKVSDGDTATLDVDCGLATHRIIVVRLAHIDAPELHAEFGVAAKARLEKLLERAPLTVTTIRDRTEKYGRMLAVIVNADGVNVADQLVVDGLGHPYEGGRR